MNKNIEKGPRTQAARRGQEAETNGAGSSWADTSVMTREQLLRELQAHRLELEMRKDEIRCTQAYLEASSERRRAEDSLKMSEARLRLAKSAAGLGLFDADLTHDTLVCDQRTREIWGIADGEPLRLATLMAGIYPDDRAKVQVAADRARDSARGGEFQAEFRVVHSRGNGVYHVTARGQAYFEDGRAVRLIGAVADISARKTMDANAQQRRSDMEQLQRQQVAAQTVAAIAHELNQPLIAVSAYSEAALQILGKGAEGASKLKEALEGAASQAQRAGRTLHELLEFVQRGEISTEAIDLNAAVRDALLIAEETGHHGFLPVLHLQPDLPPVRANRLQVEKVLVNLLSNSVEAMRESGIASSAITIIVRTAKGGTMAQVTVQDCGPGLDAANVHRIFDPFFTTKPGGTGLGLAISRSLIEAHGGQLWADLECAGGATFHFTLPLAS